MHVRSSTSTPRCGKCIRPQVRSSSHCLSENFRPQLHSLTTSRRSRAFDCSAADRSVRRTSSSAAGSNGLQKKASHPAARASSNLDFPCPVITMTRHLLVRGSSLMRRVASIPLKTGSPTSINTASGWRRSAASTPRLPSHSPAVRYPMLASASMYRERVSSSSSTTSTSPPREWSRGSEAEEMEGGGECIRSETPTLSAGSPEKMHIPHHSENREMLYF